MEFPSKFVVLERLNFAHSDFEGEGDARAYSSRSSPDMRKDLRVRAAATLASVASIASFATPIGVTR